MHPTASVFKSTIIMKVSAAVLVGCVALAATADVVSGAVQTKPGNKLETAAAASDEIEAVSSTGNHEAKKKKKRAGHRALRGADAEGAKAAKKHHKKRSLKKHNKAQGGHTGNGGGGAGNENRAYTYTAAAVNNNKKQQQQEEAANNANAPYVNNKYDYLDRYSAYLTPKQLEQLRNNNANNNPPASSNQNQETNVGGAESDDYDAVVVSTPSYSSSYTQTAAVQQPQRPVQQQQLQRPAATTTTPYVSTLDLNRGEDANGQGQEALNRGFEKEAPIAGYDAATGYGSTGNGGNANANGSGALDTPLSSSARPYVQTTEWKPIDKSVWVEHYVPGVGNNPNTPPTGSTNSNIGFPNRNPGLTTGGGSANANRIPASSAPCNGANPNAAATQPIQTIFENWLWGTCSTTAGGCRPGSCCLIRPGMGGACVSFDEICEPGQSASEGDCPYSWITSDKCACDSPISSF